MLEHIVRALAPAAGMILLVGLAGCATGVPGDSASGTEFGAKIPAPKNDVPCVEGLALGQGDSCIHDGGRFWVDGRQGCYSGRHLGQWQGDEFCSPGVLNDVCLDGSRGAVVSTQDLAISSEDLTCRSGAFGFGAEPIAGTSNWEVSQVRHVRHVEWDGRAVRVEGNCSATSGTSTKGSCLRLQISPPGGACIIGDYRLRLVCDRLDATLLNGGEVRVNGFTECDVFAQGGSTQLGLSTTRYSPIVCKVD